MKKLLEVIMLSGILATGITSCGDDVDEPQFGQGVNLLETFINRLNLAEFGSDLPAVTYGTVLEFQKEGRITQLCMMVPSADFFQLSLWDLIDTSLVTSFVMEPDSGLLFCRDLIHPVQAGSRMAVSFTGPSVFIWDNDDNPIYPSTIFDVTILGCGFNNNPQGINFPDTFSDINYLGLADVVFEPKLD